MGRCCLVIASTVALVCCTLFAGSVRADLIITFANGDTFDGDGSGSTAGPFNVDGVPTTITTVSATPNGSVLNTTAEGLGINATGTSDSASRFDPSEAWAFAFDVATFITGINFAFFSTATEEFTLQSNDFIGTGAVPTEPRISFDNATGQFTFASGSADDDFDLNELSGGVPLLVSAGTNVNVAFSGGASDTATIESVTVANPEPSTFLLSAAALSGLGFYRWRQRRRRRQ